MKKDSSRKKTNAARILDEKGINYELLSFEVSEDDLSAETAAKKLNLPEEVVFKTLLVHGEPLGYLEAVIPAGRELDLKKLAIASGNKNCAMAPLKELLPLTGYLRGGCSPIGGRHIYPVFIFEEIILHDQIIINAGARGLMFYLKPQDLIQITSATLADIAK